MSAPEDAWNSPETKQRIRALIAALREDRVSACFVSAKARAKKPKESVPKAPKPPKEPKAPRQNKAKKGSSDEQAAETVDSTFTT